MRTIPSGIVTDIQRFSLHDGPGIRTTVFLQGCNMACAWCHNPETMSLRPVLQYDSGRCINCLECIPVCPTGAHSSLDGMHLFDRSKCENCGACAEICFPRALEMSGHSVTIPEVMAEVLQDTDYYQSSGGGVTLSGGEVTMQHEFARELLRECKSQGIHTAIESNLLAPWERLATVLEFTDLLMLDVKLMETEAHQQWTRAGNEVILENVKRLAGSRIPVIVRTPVIPGVNDNAGAIREISRFISSLPNLTYYELLPYNPLGESKYGRLGATYPMHGAPSIASDRMSELKAVAAASKIPVR